MENIAGSPVEGDDFFGREADLELLTQTLRHDDVLLLGPRRIGKTSIARAAMKVVQAQGWRAIEMNVASAQDERGFLDKLEFALRADLDSLASQAWSTIKDSFGKVASRIKAVKLPIPGTGTVGIELRDTEGEDWTKVGNEALTLIAKLDQPWLIFVDELPILLFNIIRNDPANGIARVRRFLDWFRNDVRGLPGSRQVHWLISGSVGLDTLVQQHGMADTINSLRHMGLPAFSRDQAMKMVETLANSRSIQLEATHAAVMLDAIQWLQPYWIQRAFGQVRILLKTEPGSDMGALVLRAVHLLAEPGNDNELHHWLSRLTQQLGQIDAGHAVAMLNKAAATPEGARASLLLAIMEARLPDATKEQAKMSFIALRDILQRDAYWTPSGEGDTKHYKFMLEPLRRWWLRRDTL